MQYGQKTSRLALALLATTMLSQPGPVRAAPNDTLGLEFRVNTTTSLEQRLPAVAMDSGGDFVVAWQGNGYTDPYGIYAQRYHVAGAPLGPELPVNSTITGNQQNAAVARDADGDFVVVWDGYGTTDSSGIYARRYDAAGTPQGVQFPVNTYTTNIQEFAAVAMDADGDFVVVWQGEGPGDSNGVFARRFDAAGNALDTTEFLVNTYVSDPQKEPAVAIDADGDFVVVWQSTGQDDPNDPVGAGIYFQRYNAAGTKLGTETRANTTVPNDQEFPAVAMDSDGDFAVAWAGYGPGDSAGVFAQAFTASGTPAGTESRVNTTTTPVQSNPAMAMDAGGDFVVAWDSDGQDGSQNGVYARWLPAPQAIIGGGQTSEFPVNSYTTDNQRFPAVAMDADGDYVVAWESYYQDGGLHGVYAQRFEGVELMHGDFDGDGNADILWRRSDNSNTSLWLMDGLTRLAAVPFGNPGTIWQIAGIGDFNGDGKADVLWRRSDNGNTSLWLMDGVTPLDKKPIGNPGTVWAVEALRDTNGDGLSDIVWRKAATGETVVWQMSGFTRLDKAPVGNAASVWQVQ